jgi:hypothetical protein
VESGTHEELCNAKGVFYEMVKAQQIKQRYDALSEEDQEGEDVVDDMVEAGAVESHPKLSR